MPSAYEALRLATMKRNRAMLVSMGLALPAKEAVSVEAWKENEAGEVEHYVPTTSATVSPVKTPVKKRQSRVMDEAGEKASPTRSSGRLQNKVLGLQLEEISYSDEEQGDDGEYEEREDEGSPRKKRRPSNIGVTMAEGSSPFGMRTVPKVVIPDRTPTKRAQSYSGRRMKGQFFGSHPFVEVGTTFQTRMQASHCGVHAPPVGGISGGETKGAFSIALSGGYPEDIDLGYRFSYTGSGGRDLSGTAEKPKNLRTAPQTRDQEFLGPNAALATSVATGKPIRVVRGYKNLSPWAPTPDEGYRYDGMYVCTKAWMDDGESGHKVCRFAFVRCLGQPELIIQKGREAEAEAEGKMGEDDAIVAIV